MSFDLATWEKAYKAAVSSAFGERIVCAGLQGSRARNEARPDSDIDAVLVLDRLTANDLSVCRKLFRSLPCGELLCGFVSGKEELSHWDEGELVSFYFDTRPLIGDLSFIRPSITPDAAKRAVHTGACGIYHACCHGLIFGDDTMCPQGLYKAAFFVLRVKYFLQSGAFVTRSADLLPLLEADDREILRSYMESTSEKAGRPALLREIDVLLAWSSNLVTAFRA